LTCSREADLCREREVAEARRQQKRGAEGGDRVKKKRPKLHTGDGEIHRTVATVTAAPVEASVSFAAAAAAAAIERVDDRFLPLPEHRLQRTFAYDVGEFDFCGIVLDMFCGISEELAAAAADERRKPGGGNTSNLLSQLHRWYSPATTGSHRDRLTCICLVRLMPRGGAGSAGRTKRIS
jgi:hypothetical protein